MARRLFAWRRVCRIACGVSVLLAVVTGGHLGLLQVTGNVHSVANGRCYRSAQLSGSKLQSVVDRYGIKTIVNLRGASPGQAWYDQEAAQARSLGVAHVDFKMSAQKELSVAEGQKLIALMESVQKPLLIHCKAGADRTGLASALYLAAIERAGEAAAERQLSIRYGHIGVPLLPAHAMDDTFEKMEPSLGYFGS